MRSTLYFLEDIIADEDYYLNAEYLLQIANRAYDLFLSFEGEEKHS
jgi:hypothetical protein